MRPQGHRRQIFLFFAAVILPALFLSAFTLRMIRQERELVQKRAGDERRRVAAMIGNRLFDRLDGLRRQADGIVAADPDAFRMRRAFPPLLAVIAMRQDGRLFFPWDLGPEAAEKQVLISAGPFGSLIRQAEDAEFRLKNPAAAAELYRNAFGTARAAFQRNIVAQNLGRVLESSGRRAEAETQWIRLLETPVSETDEYGIPFFLWAIDRLAAGGNAGSFIQQVAGLRETKTWLSSAALPKLKDVIGTLRTRISDPAQLGTLAEIEQAVEQERKTIDLATALKGALEKTLAGIQEAGAGELPKWSFLRAVVRDLFFAPGGAFPLSYVWGIDASLLLKTIIGEDGVRGTFPGSCRFVLNTDSEGEPLSPALAGVRLLFDNPGHSAWARSFLPDPRFYWLALVLVVGVTAFGMYLLLRDVRRESRLAAAQSQFVSSVSHELKTPLTAIRMFAESLSLGWTKDPARQKEYLETIVSESERLGRLLNNVLDLSKIEQGVRIYHKEPTSLDDVIQRAARTMSFPLQQQGIALHLDLDPAMPSVMADKDALEQAVLNLLHNAMKYTGDSRDIEIVLKKDGDFAVVGVADHGFGIRDEDRARIFEKFVRIESSQNARIPGTGLGLTIVRHIAEAHGGRIEVESRPGQGSTFSLRIPMEEGGR